jgi:hypothetical protein
MNQGISNYQNWSITLLAVALATTAMPRAMSTPMPTGIPSAKPNLMRYEAPRVVFLAWLVRMYRAWNVIVAVS